MTANLLSTLKMSLELTDVLCDIERAGIKVNVHTLNTLREDFENELEELKLKLRGLAQDAMGDTPINLDSPDDRSKLLYSREVNNKQVWKAILAQSREGLLKSRRCVCV